MLPLAPHNGHAFIMTLSHHHGHKRNPNDYTKLCHFRQPLFKTLPSCMTPSQSSSECNKCASQWERALWFSLPPAVPISLPQRKRIEDEKNVVLTFMWKIYLNKDTVYEYTVFMSPKRPFWHLRSHNVIIAPVCNTGFHGEAMTFHTIH